MPTDPRPAKVTAAHSTEGTSGSETRADEAQLSPSSGVESDVSSVAMDRGLLAMAGIPQAPPFEGEAAVSGDALSDAQIMLQVKAGDDS
ncbi:MAG TPA: hypothetical protein VK198_01410, partial [Terriglobales bacterium]|nr:hypothetical protein [Terriglobales bacterium]